MIDWRFEVYVSSMGRSDVQGEIDRLNNEARERFRAAVRYLAVMRIDEWHEPRAKKLKGYKELYEIRFKANGVQHRPIGYVGPAVNEFTILIWSTHKQDVYKPSDALDSANRRRKTIKEQAAWVAPLKIDGEDFP